MSLVDHIATYYLHISPWYYLPLLKGLKVHVVVMRKLPASSVLICLLNTVYDRINF